MNIIVSKLKNIQKSNNINLLEFEDVKVLILQLNMDIKPSQKAKLYIKPTKIFLSKEMCEYENRLKVKIKQIEKGEILANVLCEYKGFKIEVLMLKENINFTDCGYIYFKSSDISIIEVLDD